MESKLARFEQATLPHMDAAYNLARWLLGNDEDAQDMVQEAYLRAFKFFDSFHGTDSRAWLLTIVRNACYTWLQQNRVVSTSFDEELHLVEDEDSGSEEIVLKQAEVEVLRQALSELPVEFREAIILREFEGLSYKEIALITKVPLGTVMSRLARARKQLQERLTSRMEGVN